ncbi:hypothetical protein C8R47DRAFT_1077361 [Mycena vitilis]|nr:hypothetical protein C8R47DRAFT_1077361 [Mycena vitilis]
MCIEEQTKIRHGGTSGEKIRQSGGLGGAVSNDVSSARIYKTRLTRPIGKNGTWVEQRLSAAFVLHHGSAGPGRRWAALFPPPPPTTTTTIFLCRARRSPRRRNAFLTLSPTQRVSPGSRRGDNGLITATKEDVIRRGLHCTPAPCHCVGLKLNEAPQHRTGVTASMVSGIAR